jgi:hypothetical protein
MGPQLVASYNNRAAGARDKLCQAPTGSHGHMTAVLNVLRPLTHTQIDFAQLTPTRGAPGALTTRQGGHKPLTISKLLVRRNSLAWKSSCSVIMSGLGGCPRWGVLRFPSVIRLGALFGQNVRTEGHGEAWRDSANPDEVVNTRRETKTQEHQHPWQMASSQFRLRKKLSRS